MTKHEMDQMLKRADECYRACRGIEDPETTIPELVGALREVLMAIEWTGWSVDDIKWRVPMAKAKEVLAKID